MRQGLLTAAPLGFLDMSAPRQVPATVLGHVPVAGDGNCLFHALGYLDVRDGAALRNEVAAFMVDQACSQHGFEDAWLEEAEELQQGTWGGHTAITAYSLMKHVRVEIHSLQPNGTTVVTDASHGNVGVDVHAPLRRVLYSNDNHYDALVELLPNPKGWAPAWKQPCPPVYFKEDEKPAAKPDDFPPLNQGGAGPGNRKQPRFTDPRPKKGRPAKKTPDAKPKKASPPAEPYPSLRRCVTKTTPPPELRDDILTELCKMPVKPRMQHPHRRQEHLVKDRDLGYLLCTDRFLYLPY